MSVDFYKKGSSPNEDEYDDKSEGNLEEDDDVPSSVMVIQTQKQINTRKNIK